MELDRETGQGMASAAGHDAELAEVIGHWSTLAEPVRLAILALVRTAK